MMNRRVAYGCALSLILSLPMLAMESRVDEAVAQQLTSANPQSISRIKDIRLVPNGNRMKLEIDTVGGTRPQVFFTQQGQSWIGDITNAQLDMGQGSYRQESPLPGVSFIEAKQVGSDSVRVQIAGTSAAPQGLLAQRSPTQLVFDFEGLPSAQVAAAPSPATMPVVAPPAPVSQPPAPQPIAQSPTQIPPQPSAGAPATPVPQMISQVPAVGQLNQPQLPPGALPNESQFQGRAIAPPSGDIAVGTILPSPPTVDLGSNAKITLTLKDAPVGDVLSLLVRRAGLNVVLNDVPPDLTISLDVNESPLQETFNFILRLKELQAQRREQTVFIGTNLPGITERLVRNYRINQAVATELAPKLSAVLNAVTPGSPAQVEIDERTNSITVIGTSQQQDIAAAQIAQLDVRKRQVLISVRAVDIQLDNNESLSVGLGGASGNFALGTFGGGNFGGTPLNQPAGSSVESVGPLDSSGSISGVFNSLNRLQQSLALRVDAAITNQTGKVLTDPKVVVADGSSSRVSIGSTVPVNVETITIPLGDNQQSITQRLVREDAGVILDVSEVRVDDNGFVTLTIQPEISIPVPAGVLEGGDFAGIQLFNIEKRQLEASQLRLRDGQTFIIAGLIEDRDIVDVRKVPLLGDLPLLGSLFRSQSVNNSRSEVVFMLTPYIMNDDVAFGLVSNP
ncbi:AMIN domain-containing protein [Thermostichus vulcanus]|uniref:AMIN domain-containing protein n=1 Tax=Thermostichus vulcanus str. 'Rupite' TaxID=2813851 RepID=A0ABT0C9V4_THEVL|nr:AMIN domain-containing protein [Thermostichus vulcanus]MCJ2542571.1 AMIN domain-containing protein [Thermostichus vulcanus str. 'Rupite']